MKIERYINEVWPQVNKWAIQMDKEAFERAVKTVRAKREAKIIPASQIPVGYIR